MEMQHDPVSTFLNSYFAFEDIRCNQTDHDLIHYDIVKKVQPLRCLTNIDC